MDIRKATSADLPRLLELYAGARQFMAANGNPTQWGDSYPELSLLEGDIARGELYVVQEAAEIVGVFMFFQGPEPTYTEIFDGDWKNDAPYGTIHRLASAGTVRGVGQFCLDWCYAQCGNLRGDTHHDNHVMQAQFLKNGFEPCGTVYMADGSARIAYQRL
jgi:hypothetical protein